jgi:hypothetical protein
MLLNDGNGGFQEPQKFDVRGQNILTSLDDVNGDSIIDIVAFDANPMYKTSNFVTVFLGRGDGTFLARQMFSLGVESFYFVVGDLNGDNRLDMAASGDGVFAIMNNGSTQ